MGGTPVMSSTAVTGMPASAIAVAVPPDDTSSTPRSLELPGELDDAGLVVHREQCPRDLRAHQLASRLSATNARSTSGIDPPFDFLDPLVQGLDGVVGQDRHRLLREDRALVDLEPREVHGAAR